MNMNNIDIRIAVVESGFTYKKIAEEIGISHEWLSRLMSHELSDENKKRILKSIDSLKNKEKNLNPIKFNVVECVESGSGFLKGCFYSQVGTNNGIQIQRQNGNGDCVTYICCTGGVGKGTFNGFGDSGNPSFIEREVTINE